MKRLSKEKIELVLKLYSKKFSRKEIAERVGIHENSIGRILKKNNVKLDRVPVLTEEQIDKIIDMYSKNISSEIIAKNIGINGSTVCRVLKRNGIKIRPATENKRKYNINEDFFEVIDSEIKAYFLGFLYADGNIRNENGSSIRLTVHPKDRDILVKFSQCIYGFEKIDILKPKNLNNDIDYPGVAIYSRKMVNSLIKLGCTPRKSFTITFPNNINKSLLPHFIRGYFDGDGCICLTDSSRARINIVSTEEFLNGLSEYLKTQFEFKNHLLQKRHKDRDTNTRSLEFSSQKEVFDFLNLIYNNSSIYLDRKYNLYLEYLSKRNIKKNSREEKISNIDYYGSVFVPEVYGYQLTSDSLKKIDNDLKKKISKELISFYREKGFPFVRMTDDELFKGFTKLKNIDTSTIVKEGLLTLFNTTGSRIIKHFFPHFFEVKSGISTRPSIMEAFQNDNYLEKVIYNRLFQNFTLNGNMLRQGMVNSHIAYRVSFFNILIAKYIYSRYVPENGIIYDYSMGFGQRLLGALSLPYKVKYIGVDVWNKNISSGKNMFGFFNKTIPMLNKEVELINIGSEDYLDYEDKVDFAFSSPPYYNLELYSSDENQAYNRSYTEFINLWWRTVVKNIFKMLKNDGIFAVNINEKLPGYDIGQNIVDVACEEGFEKIDTLKIKLSKHTKFNTKQGKHKYEPIFIMKKS